MDAVRSEEFGERQKNARDEKDAYTVVEVLANRAIVRDERTSKRSERLPYGRYRERWWQKGTF